MCEVLKVEDMFPHKKDPGLWWVWITYVNSDVVESVGPFPSWHEAKKWIKNERKKMDAMNDVNSKAVLISIHPKWCNLIVSGRKTIEIRKSAPSQKTPFRCYIYCTVPKKAVIGEFVCDRVENLDIPMVVPPLPLTTGEAHNIYDACLEISDVMRYADGRGFLCCWHISELNIYKEPLSLTEFRYANRDQAITKPPQSWCYVERRTR